MTFALPLAMYPGLDNPFSTPKALLLEGFVLAGGALALCLGQFRPAPLPRAFRLALLLLLLSLTLPALFGAFLSPDTLWLSLAAPAWFLLLLALRPEAKHLATAATLSCAVVAAIALLQWADLDPFRLAGWTVSGYGSERMRVLATLGNPNFVAATLAAAVPLAWALAQAGKQRGLFMGILTAETLAVLATGSRAGILALAAGMGWLGLLGKIPPRLIAAATALLLLLLPLLPSRSILTTIEGRFYIWKVSAAHLGERPLLGWGPGGFEPKFIEWETRYWQAGHGKDRERPFAQLQAHAHNEYLEAMVDGGILGLAGLLALLGSFLVFAFRNAKIGGDLATGGAGGVVALSAASLVDFPLHRPAELVLLWTLMAVAFLACRKPSIPPAAAIRTNDSPP